MTASARPRVLALIPHYLPGYKYGGPIRTLANMVEHLGAEYDFRIITRDRDALEAQPYPDVRRDAWNALGSSQVFYASPKQLHLGALARLIDRTPHELLYLNSFFHPILSVRPMLARRLGRLRRRPVIVAPRGEFTPGAFTLKAWKKRPFVLTARLSGLYQDVIYQASTTQERTDIQRIMGARTTIVVARDLPPPAITESPVEDMQQRVGQHHLRVVFLSLIAPKKNLDFALGVLAQVRQPIVLSVYGPEWDRAYASRCRALAERLPEHITIRWQGSVKPQDVPDIMAAHDVFLLPTRAENYGHVIAEAISAGTPALISDQTPWRNLEAFGVGWALPLDAPTAFVQRIETLASEDETKRRNRRAHIREQARRLLALPETLEASRAMLDRTLATDHREQGRH